MAISFPTAMRTSRAAAISTAAGGSPSIRIYGGTPPATSTTALSGNNLLASLPCAFSAASNGALATSSITTTNAVATGVATFGRLFATDGTTVLMQFAVGTSGSDLNLNSVSIQSGGPVAVSSWVLTEPAS